MLVYGYTFVGKGTIQAFIPDLEHEGDVYRRLKPIQGAYVPVLLGTINLRALGRTYYFEHRVYIIHLTLLSYGGESIRHISRQAYPANLRKKHLSKILHMVHQQGVVHEDIRADNILFCRDINETMLIDFERSKLLETPRIPFAQIDDNKRPLRKAAAGKFRQLGRPGMSTRDTLAAEAMY